MKPILRRTLLFCRRFIPAAGPQPARASGWPPRSRRRPRRRRPPPRRPPPKRRRCRVSHLRRSAGAGAHRAGRGLSARRAALQMALDAPDEALKAQAIAIYTFYSARRLQNTGGDADFTCNSAEKQIYMTDDDLAALYGRAGTKRRPGSTHLRRGFRQQLFTTGAPIEATFLRSPPGARSPTKTCGARRATLSARPSPAPPTC